MAGIFQRIVTLVAVMVLGITGALSQSISSIDPDSAWQNQTLQVSISGTSLDFAQGTSVMIWIKQGNDSIVSYADNVSPTTLVSTFSIPSSANTGLYDLLIGEQGVSVTEVQDGFEILPELPLIQPPNLFSPENLTTITSQPVTLQWSTVAAATQYEYEVSFSPGFQYIESSGTTANTSVTLTLSTGEVYWRVRSLNQAGNPGIWSGMFSFTNSPPAHLTAIDPNQGYAGQPQFSVDISGVNLPFAPATSAVQHLTLEQGGDQITASSVEMLWSWGGNAQLDIPLNSPVGFYDLIYEYPPYSPYTLQNAFYVTEGNQFEGQVYIDLNGNQVFDGPDIPYPYATVLGGSAGAVATQSDGFYMANATTGSYNVTLNVPSLFTVDPPTHTINFSGSGELIQSVDFALSAQPGVHDVMVVLDVDVPPRPDLDMVLELKYKNLAPVLESGQISIELPSGMTVSSSSDSNYTVNGSTVTWNYVDLIPLEMHEIEVHVYTPLSYQINDEVSVSGTITALGPDNNPMDNQHIVETTVVNSYDPNFKEVSPAGELTPEVMSGDAYMYYTVHFQNTGTAEAINIYIHDTISQLLNLSTFQFIGATHNAEVNMLDNRLIEFRFPNIYLPDSTSNEPESHGSLTYRIKPHQMLSGLDVIENTAHIYFDLNAPIITNTTENWILSSVQEAEKEDRILHVWPNPTSGPVKVMVPESSTITVFDISGKARYTVLASGLIELDLIGYRPGVYIIQSVNEEGTLFAKVILE